MHRIMKGSTQVELERYLKKANDLWPSSDPTFKRSGALQEYKDFLRKQVKQERAEAKSRERSSREK
jgi:hypothetical protein